MPYLETLASCIAVEQFAALWKDQRVLLSSHCMATVALINSGAASDPALSQLLRRIATAIVLHNVELRARYVPGKQNVLCDLLSRSQISAFLAQSGLSTRSRICLRGQTLSSGAAAPGF